MQWSLILLFLMGQCCFIDCQLYEFHYIKEAKTWTEAQQYCREKHTDLVTVTNMKDMKRLINMSDGDIKEAWIGLPWNLQFNNEIINSGQCVMTVFDDGGRWKNENCTERKPFICYDDKLILIKENKTWHEALTYCRQNHHDLVTITNMDEQKQAQEKTKKASTPFVWIGLRFNCRMNVWFWVCDNWVWDGQSDECNMFGAMQAGGEHRWFQRNGSERFNFFCLYECEETKKTYKYHLIEEEKTWLEAQSYCREKHTDLISGTKQLQDEELKERHLEWSDGSSFSFRHWNLEINDHQPNSGRCAMTGLHDGDRWKTDSCEETKPFICYDVLFAEDNVILVKEKMNWEDALYYCRDHHHDLVTITNMDQQKWIQEKVKEASTGYVWMGLRYTCTLDFWFWVSDEVVIFENWAKGEPMDDCDMSGAMETGGDHQWRKKNDLEEFNFLCTKD
ncbi:C-type mannose receptor 2-like [Poeciliopsis prolifica]|uniref:C-type mannose receptor 2-like n=1 Tax=Poeciliopsis prolifica TaxID=188132 RepID=UPI002414315C|nr:C-type mannose receptor 2-like [Poeciliopsis prolifica]